MSHQPELPFATTTRFSKSEVVGATRYEYAKSMHDLQEQKRQMGKTGLRYSSAYVELGGGLLNATEKAAQTNRYAEFIENFEDWKQDIAIGFEGFNLPELTVFEVGKMREEDQRVLALHFDDYVDTIGRRGKILATPGSAADQHFASYGFESETQAIEYGRELQRFADAVTQSEVYSNLHYLAWRIEPNAHRRHQRVLNGIKTKGHVLVIRDTKGEGKLRIYREQPVRHSHAS